MTDNPVLLEALACAQRGWPVFPCLPGQKIPATRHGYLDATTDPGQISHWFARHPDRNLAVATGDPGPDILDIDTRGPAGNGFAALKRLRAAGLLRGHGRTLRTPSGGLHVYFLGSGQRTSHLAAVHIDFLSGGGYALIPPSHIGHSPYRQLRDLCAHSHLKWSDAVRVLAPSRSGAAAPGQDAARAAARLAEASRPAGRPPAGEPPWDPALGNPPAAQIAALARFVSAQHESNRNNALFWAANRALETDPAADLSPLEAAAHRAGLTEPEITRTLNSARRTSQAQPEPPGHQAEGAS